jgi:hypothetical protein
MAARMALFPPRWQSYEVDGNGNVTVKANAKLAPAGAKTPNPDIPPPASTWATPPADVWPPKRQ